MTQHVYSRLKASSVEDEGYTYEGGWLEVCGDDGFE